MYQMLHTKFQGHRSIDSGEEDFLRFYHIRVWRPFWSCDSDHLNNFRSSNPVRPYMKFGSYQFSGSEEKSFESMERRRGSSIL